MNSDREMLIDAILGREPITVELIMQLEGCSLGRWRGGHIDSWEWNRNKVRSLDIGELQHVYHELRATQE